MTVLSLAAAVGCLLRIELSEICWIEWEYELDLKLYL